MDPKISCQCCLLRPPDKSLRKCYRRGDQEEVYSIMLEECFELQLREGGICKLCVSRLVDACDFKRQVQRCQQRLQGAVNGAVETKVKQEKVDLPIDFLGVAETKVKQEKVDLPIEFLDDGVKTEPSDSSDDGLEIDQDYPHEVKIEWKTEALESPEECELEATGIPRTDDVDEPYTDPKEGGQPINIPHSVVQSSQSLGSSAEEHEAGTESKGRKRKKKQNETEDSNCTPLLSGDSGPNADKKKKPTRRPARKDKQKSDPGAGTAPGSRTWALDAHETNVRTLIQHSNCTPFLTKTIAGIQCCYCKENFLNMALLREHIQSAHANDQYRDTNSRLHRRNDISCKMNITDLKCKLCEQNFDLVPSLKEHLITEHDVKFLPEEHSYIYEFKLSDDGGSTKCALCSSIFDLFQPLARHMNSHYRNFVCNTCDMGFLNEYKMAMHQKIHEMGTFKCSVCPKVFQTSMRQLRHENHIHSNLPRSRPVKNKYLLGYDSDANIYKCSICHNLYTTHMQLSVHLRKVHTLPKRLKCPKCDYASASNASLKEHMIRHVGNRIYKCPECGKGYARKRTLTEHIKIHNSERSFKCVLCRYPFLQKAALKRHMFRIHGITSSEFEQAKQQLVSKV